MGRGARGVKNHVKLRSGKNQCEIRAKHKNFGKILICPEKIFVSLRKLRGVRENFLICAENFFDMSGKKFLVKKFLESGAARLRAVKQIDFHVRGFRG